MSIYNFKIAKANGEVVDFSEYKGKVLLIVNTATGCGFTPQYEGLEALYGKYKDQGFHILDFPCNQFGNQAPGTNDEIVSFCKLNYNVSFTQFQKIEVNGENEHPLYKYLKSQKSGVMGDKIKWNFTKFLVDREGRVVGRFAPMTTPEKLEEKIKAII